MCTNTQKGVLKSHVERIKRIRIKTKIKRKEKNIKQIIKKNKYKKNDKKIKTK